MNWKAISYLCIFLLTFIDPFLFNFPLGPLRITAIRVVIIILTGIVLYMWLMKKEDIWDSYKHVKFPLLFLVVWFIYGVNSLLWTTDQILGIKELYYFVIYLLYIFVLLYILSDRTRNFWIQKSFWFIGVLTIAISTLEILTRHHLSTSRYAVDLKFALMKKRVATAFFYNENDLALFLVMIAPFFLVRFLSKSHFIKIINVVIYLSIWVIIYVNEARLALISLMLQFIFFVYYTNRKLLTRMIQISLVFIPVFLGMIFWYIQNNISSLTKIVDVQEKVGSGYVRLNLYLNGLYSTFQSFMLGVGPGNYEKHMDPSFETEGIVNPHNWWIEILTNYGLWILVLYIIFFVYLIKELVKVYRMNENDRFVALAFLLSYIGFIIACVGPSRLFYFWPMWLVYALTLVVINQFYKKHS